MTPDQLKELERLNERWANLPDCKKANDIADECMGKVPELLKKIEELENATAEMKTKIAEHDNACDLVQEYVDATAAVMDETCGKDEKHCACVPLLRYEAKRIRAEASTYAKAVNRLQKAFDDQCNASRQDAAEIERLKKACAEYRKLTEAVKEVAHEFLDDEEGHFSQAADHALSADCGKDYVPRSELDAAHKACAEMRRQIDCAAMALEFWYNLPNPTPGQIDVAIEALRKALSTDCGKGWKSPGEYSALEKKCADLQLIIDGLNVGYYADDEWKPVVTALAQTLEHLNIMLDIDGRPLDSNDRDVINDAQAALAHAERITGGAK